MKTIQKQVVVVRSSHNGKWGFVRKYGPPICVYSTEKKALDARKAAIANGWITE